MINELALLVLALIGLAGTVVVPLVWLLARTMSTLTRVTAGSHREIDRERRDMHDMLMRCLENQSNPATSMMQHATERMERMRLETSLQRDEIRSEQRPVDGAQVAYGGQEAASDITLALE